MTTGVTAGANTASSSNDVVQVPFDQFNKLVQRVNLLESTTPSKAFTNSPGTTRSAFQASLSPSTSWIVYSGATDHMTGKSTVFSSFTHYSVSYQVILADGDFTPIFLGGEGTVKVSPSLSLSSVLKVPSFPTCILSVSSLTKNLNFNVTFFPTHFLFMDLKTRRTIGGGREANGLDFLCCDVDVTTALHSSADYNKERVSLWHARLWTSVPAYTSFLDSYFFEFNNV